jgi:uncharacterized protein (TIGR03083 family)
VTTTPVLTQARRIGHLEAMSVGAVEYQRFIDLLRTLDADDWARPTDCSLWDVKAVVAHNLANLESSASIREMVHQMRTARARSKTSGALMLDELTSLQVSERAAQTPAELIEGLAAVAPRAIRGRRRVPAVMRRLVNVPVPPPFDSMELGFLIDTIYNRDVWMHRIDICRATGREPVLDADHDGRLVSEIVYDWAARHGQPYELVLDGPAGGTFTGGSGGARLHLDAVEFARIVSGRDSVEASGLMTTPVLY